MKTLLFIPTYNEKDNVDKILAEILALYLDLDILFIDDNSPDGTGRVLDKLASENERLSVFHRSGKLGIGSAHHEAIDYAYRTGYTRMVTMDCDFTHSPKHIPELLERSKDYDVIVGSRHMRPDSLDDWELPRLFMTKLGHVMTTLCLKLPYDATGAFRVYRLDRVPREAFDRVRSLGYSFFFESLFVLHFNGFSIYEVPIVLPARALGQSKMTFKDALTSTRILLTLSWEKLKDRKRFLLPARHCPGGVKSSD